MIFISSDVYSQDDKVEPIILTEFLTAIEAHYDVKFSYEDKTVASIFVTPFKFNIPLEDVLFTLNKETKLRFNKLDVRFIAVTKAQKQQLFGNVQNLDEVIITNYLTKGITKTINANVNVNTEAYDILPGLIESDVLQIVQNLPGVTSVDERISNLNIRGGTNDQNLVYYEGIRMYQTGHFFGLISAFNPYLTQKINVSKNGTSAKFGNGVSGIINIKNSDNLDSDLKAGLGLNLLTLDGYAKLPVTDNTELQISVRRSLTDIFTSATYDAYYKRIFENTPSENERNVLSNERFFFYDINSKFLFKIDDTSKLNFNMINIFNTLNYDLTDANSAITQNTLSQLSFGVSSEYSKLWSNQWNTILKVYYSNYVLGADTNNISDNQRLVQENVVADYGLRLDASKLLNSNFKLNAGYQFNEVGVNNLADITQPEFRSFIKEIMRTHALFSEVEWTSKSKSTYLRLGGRANYYEKLKTFILEPRFNFNHTFLKHLQLEILGEYKSQSIAQVIDYDADFFGVETRRWQLANDNVPIVTSKQASVGLSYTNKGLLISADAYFKNVDDITTRSQGFQNQYQFVNAIGSYNVMGLDFLVNRRYHNLSTWFSYTYSKNNYTFDALNSGNSFPNNLDIRHVANASVTYKYNKLNFGLAMNWRSGKPFTQPLSVQNTNLANIEYGSPNNSRLNDYFRTDLSATYNFNLNKKGVKAQLSGSIWNIFNQNNSVNRYFTLDENGTVIQNDTKALGWTPNISFRVKFQI